ncbi:MAG: ATP-binding protein [Sutterellaceae bacterium]|nr:ATP-binding protein [Sutterellaceae bacterium]
MATASILRGFSMFHESNRSLKQDLTFTVAEKLLKENGFALDREQMQKMLLVDDEAYTDLAMLLSDQCPFSIKIAVFEDCTHTLVKDRTEIFGSVLEQATEALKFLNFYNATRSVIGEIKRIDTRNYPPQALREAVVNAIVHRDYALSGDILIYVFEDRIEIVSPGSVPNGFAFEEMEKGYSSLRNPHLGEVFRRLKLMETYGIGIARIKLAYADSDSKPTFTAGSAIFRVSLPNRNYQFDVNRDEEGDTGEQSPLLADRIRQIREHYGHDRSFERKDLEALFGLTTPTVIGILSTLKSHNWIEGVRQGKRVLYRLKG